MRDSFRAYYPPTETELAEIWEEGIIVLDTNTLLNFFRYTPGTRDEFLEVLEKLRSSLWIPHQVGLEFHRRRLGVINTTSEAFSKITDSLEKARKDIASTLNGYKHHPSLNRSDILKEIDEFFANLTAKLAAQQQDHQQLVISDGDAEQTFQRISSLFSNRVGTAFSADDLASLYEEGQARYEKRVPPGYKDRSDSNSNQYGDLVIWKEILNFGAKKKLPMIFVTDDTKEDWWWIDCGKTQGPRVELVDEYWTCAERRIHFYEPLRFLEYAKVRTNTEISPQSLEEVKEVSSASSRAPRLLRDRKATLEKQRAQILRQIERRNPDRPSASERRNLLEERESIAAEQRGIERRLENVREQARPSTITRGDRRGENGVQDILERDAALEHRTAELHAHLLALRRRQEHIDRQLHHGEDREHQVQRLWDGRISRIEEELNEVTLALDELDE